MPDNQIETFDDLLNAWLHADREADKRALWRTLARGGWFRACRHAVQRTDTLALTAWLDKNDALKRDIITFNGDHAAQMALTHLHCGLAACGERDAAPVTDSAGFCRDLVQALSDLPLRPALRSISQVVSGSTLHADSQGSAVDLGLGMTVLGLNDHMTVNFSGNYLVGEEYDALSGQVAVKLTW